ncbi:transcription factor HES-5 [Hyperolius riggenbachi]|uniref:transcription factor HES-5 n=1 Tax=Hyperolius riggenbachi TaxID=752182 RepID=UPI0035A3402B
MAPTSASVDNLSPKEKNKLRKPVVEKMRRDRINNCIEQLKALLEKEFHKQQPNVKLEKADILEMTVSYLQQQKNQHTTISMERLKQDYKQGYSWCVTEAMQFLCHYPESGEAQKKLLNHLSVPQKVPVIPCLANSSDIKQAASAILPAKIWRPW